MRTEVINNHTTIGGGGMKGVVLKKRKLTVELLALFISYTTMMVLAVPSFAARANEEKVKKTTTEQAPNQPLIPARPAKAPGATAGRRMFGGDPQRFAHAIKSVGAVQDKGALTKLSDPKAQMALKSVSSSLGKKRAKTTTP